MIGQQRFLVPVILVIAACVVAAWSARPKDAHPELILPRGELHPRHPDLDSSGYGAVNNFLRPWPPDATLEQIAQEWKGIGARGIAMVEARLSDAGRDRSGDTNLLMKKAAFQLYDGDAQGSYETISRLRATALDDPRMARHSLASLIFLQGVAAMRRGENDNCIACRGESSCIFPISPAAVHTNPAGSRLAVKHFNEYLELFPDDVGIRWLLKIAHMTLGESSEEGDPRFHNAIDRFFHSEFDIGAFHDKSREAGLDRFNQSGGAIMDDFDNDGLLDIVVTANDSTESMAYYRNRGDGTFDDRSASAGVTGQLGGLVCYQADYNNDGRLDIFIPRGAWLPGPVRPTLLENNGAGGFTDVTRATGLFDPVNSNGAAWGDFDNDGWIDLFVACEHQHNRLYRNRGDGTFEDIAVQAGVASEPSRWGKGCTWIDYDNDGFLDLFVTNYEDTGRLYHNERDGRFEETTLEMGIIGPKMGFACWAWDYDNDGWLDLFAASSDRNLNAIVNSMIGEPHHLATGKLFRNSRGTGFEDRTAEAGLAGVYAPMGCNFADFDNDGWLDFYLGTGEPSLATLVPNRMFKNVSGARFADITGSSRTGHLQKGHAVACGDWDRDGDVDLFIEMGGAVNGDKYHNILFQNPGQGNHWLTVKLIGRKTNRAAIGARIKVVTDGPQPRSIFRLVSSGSSFGANALQQTIGLAGAEGAATLEITWPASHTTQVFHGVAADQAISITEFDDHIRPLGWTGLLEPH